jgi:hypothetical protein
MLDGRKRKRLLGLFFSSYKAVFRIPDVLMRIRTTRLRIRDPDLALSISGFQDASKKSFFLLIFLLISYYIYISLQRQQVTSSHKTEEAKIF